MKRPRYYTLGPDHSVIPSNDFRDWVRIFESDDGRRVAFDDIGPVSVSTVFLGLDHGFRDDAPPLVFETMIFGGEHDGYQDRCSTWQEAEAAHRKAVALVRSLKLVKG